MKWRAGRNERWGRYERAVQGQELFLLRRISNGSWQFNITSLDDEQVLRPWVSEVISSKKLLPSLIEGLKPPPILTTPLDWHKRTNDTLVAKAGDGRLFEVAQVRARRWSLRTYREGQRLEEWPAGGMTHFRTIKEAKAAAQALALGWLSPALTPEEGRRLARKKRLDI